MFSDIETLVVDLRKKVSSLQLAVIYGGTYFHALALAVCYNELIRLADERTQSHPEVQRVPELRTVLLEHFIENADRHISVRNNSIFLATLLGGPNTIRDWQESGYHTKRTQSNYPARLRYWKAIYDQAPILFQTRVSGGDNLFSGASTYQSSFISNKGKIPKRPDITYEEVIFRRNSRYSGTQSLVPWWWALNYGTSVGGVSGYPSTQGLHFVEDAERLIPDKISEYSALFDQFVNDVFDREDSPQDAILLVEQWAYQHIRTGVDYVPVFDVARILTFGVPF